MKDLGKKTVTGLLYKFGERIGVQIINFFVTIVLARLLAPEAFGTIAMVTIVITILDVFITYGFGNSLVVDKESDDLDFSTCFHFGLFIATIFYVCVYLCAPYLSVYFENEELTPVIRVMALQMPIAAINSVQQAYVSKKMMFRKFFISTSIGTVLSGIISVIMAYTGFGVWSLVFQYLAKTGFDTIFLSFIVDWKPKFIFSFQRLKKIYDYGWKILFVGLIDTVYSQLRNFIIAKKYSKADLAYYTKGMQFPGMGMNIIEPTINGVIFPAISNCNDDTAQMKSITRRLIKSSTILVFPLMIWLIVVAKPLTIFLITDKWLDSVIFLQIGCMAYLFRPVQIINNCVIRGSGRSGLLLKLDLIKKAIGIALLIASMPYGVKAIAWSFVLVNIISTFINIWPNRYILKYGYREQLMDIIPALCLSVFAGVLGWSIYFFKLPVLTTLVLQTLICTLVYWLMSKAMKFESYIYLEKKVIEQIQKFKT